MLGVWRGKRSIHNPYVHQVKTILVYINRDKLVKEEWITKNSREVSGTKSTHGRKMLPKVNKTNEKYKKLQPQDFQKITFHRFNICIL